LLEATMAESSQRKAVSNVMYDQGRADRDRELGIPPQPGRHSGKVRPLPRPEKTCERHLSVVPKVLAITAAALSGAALAVAGTVKAHPMTLAAVRNALRVKRHIATVALVGAVSGGGLVTAITLAPSTAPMRPPAAASPPPYVPGTPSPSPGTPRPAAPSPAHHPARRKPVHPAHVITSPSALPSVTPSASLVPSAVPTVTGSATPINVPQQTPTPPPPVVSTPSVPPVISGPPPPVTVPPVTVPSAPVPVKAKVRVRVSVGVSYASRQAVQDVWQVAHSLTGAFAH
jgi:hypothetical protein